jgi:hypothetical protein
MIINTSSIAGLPAKTKLFSAGGADWNQKRIE